MKIGIDLRPLQGETQYRGIGKALGFFLEAFKDIVSTEDSLVFYIDSGLPKPEVLKLFSNYETKLVAGSPIGRMRYVRSVLPAFPALKPSKDDVDVVLQYDASLGVPTNVPAVTLFHDLIPYLFRGEEKQMQASGIRKYKNKLAGALYWKKYLRMLSQYRKSAAIIAISESSKRDLLKYDPSISAEKVNVVYLGARAQTISGKAPAELSYLNNVPFLLYVGGIDLRKNIAGLLKSFYDLKPSYPKLKLVCVGKEFSLQSQLTDLSWTDILNANPDYAKDVLLPGFVDEAALSFLYEKARAFVFPSRYEGFGLPVIEAMQAGCPVVAFNNSSIPEVGGKAALLLPDGENLAVAVSSLLEDDDLREKLIKQGKAQAKIFTWKKTAKKTLDILRNYSK